MAKLCLVFLCASIILFSFAPVAAQEEEPKEKLEQPQEQPAQALIQWELTYDAALKKAKEENKPLLIYFYEPGKKLCEGMENEVFAAPDVAKYAEKFVCYKEDRKKGQGAAIRFRVPVTPFVLVVSGDDEKPIGNILDCIEWQIFLEKLKAVYGSIAAEKELKEKLSQSQDDPESNFKLAEIWEIRGYTDLAIPLYEKVVNSDPKNEKGFMIDAALRLAELNFGRGRPDEVRKQFKRVIDADPENKKGTKEHSAFGEARILVQFENKYDEGIAALTNFISTYPESKLLPNAYFLLGYTYYMKNDDKNAVANWEIVINKFPENPLTEKAKSSIEIAKQESGREKRK